MKFWQNNCLELQFGHTCHAGPVLFVVLQNVIACLTVIDANDFSIDF